MSAVADNLKQGTLDEAVATAALLKAGPVPTLVGYRADELLTATFPPRRPIFERDGQVFFAAGEIGEIYATRGFGKTWFLMTIALMVANGKDQMGFAVPEARRVLYVDGEMARQDIQDRFKLLCDRTELIMSERLMIVAADWQDDFLPRIDTPRGQAALEPFVDSADLIIFDNRSCLFDAEGEKDPTAWQPAQDYLLSLRRKGKAVLLAHHANRQGGARGIGKPEDPMNLVMKLVHPADYKAEHGARFICDLTPPDGKARGIWGPAAAPFGVRLTPNGWIVEAAKQADESDADVREKIVEYLTLAEAARDLPKSANNAYPRIKGSRNAFMKIWGDMLDSGEIVAVLKNNGKTIVGYKLGVLITPAAPF